MITLRKSDDYAFQLMRELAQHPDAFLNVEAFATSHHISVAVVKQIAAALKKAGLIISKEGSGGGYRLAKDPHTITFHDIVVGLCGPVQLSSCSGDDHHCHESTESCSMHAHWDSLNNQFAEMLGKVRLSDLVISEIPQ